MHPRAVHADCQRCLETSQHWQGLELEREGIIELESRIEVAEAERDAARDQMQVMTPRPGLPPGMALPSQLGPEGTAKLVTALAKHRWRSLASCSRDCRDCNCRGETQPASGLLQHPALATLHACRRMLALQSLEPIIIRGLVAGPPWLLATHRFFRHRCCSQRRCLKVTIAVQREGVILNISLACAGHGPPMSWQACFWGWWMLRGACCKVHALLSPACLAR